VGFFDKLLGRPPEAAKKLGRNDQCWCGSGEKYKRCHQQSDEKHFERQRAAVSCTRAS
jgi:hypothetical protein